MVTTLQLVQLWTRVFCQRIKLDKVPVGGSTIALEAHDHLG
jgi:hypothetical protein